MITAEKIKPSVLAMYMAHPFPQLTAEERCRWLGGELCAYRFLGLESAMKDAKFLEVGCGTGNRSMLIAKHFGVREFVGLDHSTASLDVARRVAAEERFDRFVPVEGDLFNIPYPDGYFDVVVSWGVLHHTDNPLRGLKEIVRLCRPGGMIGIYLYNKYNHWRHNLQKNKVDRLAGDSFEKRFEVAHQLYGTTPINDMTPEDIALFYDKYCHPHKSDHTIGETLSWFDQLGLQYQGSHVPMRFLDFLRMLKYRGELLQEFPVRTRMYGAMARAFSFIPLSSTVHPPRKRPTIVHLFLWQAFWAWQGRSGGYSQGSSLSARKPG